MEDPNFDPGALLLEDESPYPEVRSAVANTDDPEMPWFAKFITSLDCLAYE